MCRNTQSEIAWAGQKENCLGIWIYLSVIPCSPRRTQQETEMMVKLLGQCWWPRQPLPAVFIAEMEGISSRVLHKHMETGQTFPATSTADPGLDPASTDSNPMPKPPPWEAQHPPLHEILAISIPKGFGFFPGCFSCTRACFWGGTRGLLPSKPSCLRPRRGGGMLQLELELRLTLASSWINRLQSKPPPVLSVGFSSVQIG